MVKFNFNAFDYDPVIPPPPPELRTPEKFAADLWKGLTKFKPVPDSPDEAIARARHFKHDWEALRDWMRANEADLSDEWKVATFHLWLNDPPKEARGSNPLPTEYRDWVLRNIAFLLCKKYGLRRTQSQPRGSKVCASSVLAKLPNTPDEGTIANII